MKNICTHRSFRSIYKAINFHSTFCNKGGQTFVCGDCGDTCVLTWKGCKDLRKLSLKNMFRYFLWMLPAIIFILLFVQGNISAEATIGLTILYHLLAMWGIIEYSPHLKISKENK